MATLNKKSPIVEIFTTAALKQDLTGVQKDDYKDARKLIMDLAANPNPMNLYELSQIIAYTVDNVMAVRLNFLPQIAEVRNTAFNERAKFKTRTQTVRAYWQAIGSTPDVSKIGHKYSDLKIEELSALVQAEWGEIASGQYDFVDLINEVTNEFEAKIAQKVQNTLYATFSSLPSPNYGSGNGIVQATFDTLLAAMQRFGRAAIVGDYEALQKLPALTALSGRTSDDIINEYNRSGLIGTYKGALVVTLANPYEGATGFNTVLDKGLIYIVPAMDDASKTLKVQFAGDVMPMQTQDVKDASYYMRFDRHMGAGVVAARHPMAVYEDTSF